MDLRILRRAGRSQLRGRLSGLAASFGRDASGAVALMLGILLLPLLMLISFGIDYTASTKASAELDAAADAAVLSVVTRSGLALSAEDARVAAEQYFRSTVSGGKAALSVDVKADVKDKDGVRSAEIRFTAATPTSIMSLLGFRSLPLEGIAKAQSPAPVYRDFYLLLDNSPSMGLAATQADITKMEKNTGCAFACHDLSSKGNDLYAKAKTLGVQMRIDLVRNAAMSLMDRMDEKAMVKKQFRSAIYTPGTDCTKLGLTEIAGLSGEHNANKNKAKNIDLMTIPYQGYYDDQCTDFDGSFAKLSEKIQSPGNGATETSPLKVVFFVSDGVADANTPYTCSKKLSGKTRCQEPIKESTCKLLKDRGIKVAVLYTTYRPINNDWYRSWIAPFQPTIGTRMSACASPDLYTEVQVGDDITTALNKLFDKALAQTRLTQ
ncbi:pilus assembly protein TadG-related protein [Methylobacterium oryzisoli]|uniref:pilus assembly protein TadG-related protein n=1 Tax=Methylobacterium oryzisoli TaxID=3385502 RepID=UPI0038923AE6